MQKTKRNEMKQEQLSSSPSIRIDDAAAEIQIQNEKHQKARVKKKKMKIKLQREIHRKCKLNASQPSFAAYFGQYPRNVF